MSVKEFYDAVTPWYHLLYEDWYADIDLQASALDSVVRREWGGGVSTVLDVAAGIGTQALGLMRMGYTVIASDLSEVALARARREGRRWRRKLPAAAADVRRLPYGEAVADLVIACDNALPHLPDEAAIAAALAECRRCVRPGGGVLAMIRDYGAVPPPGTVEVWTHGTRREAGRTLHVQQVWRWEGERYDLALEIRDDEEGVPVAVHHSSYLAITTDRVAELMREVGLADVQRLDDVTFQPVVIGTRAR